MTRCPAHPSGNHYFVFFGRVRRNATAHTYCIDCGVSLKEAKKIIQEAV